VTVRLIEEVHGAVSHSRDLADGSTIRVRRRVDGTDVFIDPPKASAADPMGADLTDVLGTDRAVNDRHDARRVIEAALDRYDGPCSQAYADVLSAYVAATKWGRANLFLEVAFRALGVAPPSGAR
jgi:hypothetical protein